MIDERSKGLGFALSAFLLWGLAPVFFKLLADVDSFEVLAHRVIWSFLILALVLQWRGRWHLVWSLDRAIVKRLFWTSVFVSSNWLVFIWAVAQGRVLETSLGYFINPLISVLFGMLFLSERLRTGQWVALILALCGVLNQVVLVGYLPWVALALALSFATYGLLRKRIDIDPVTGLFVETALLLPFAALYLLWLGIRDSLSFNLDEPWLALVLAGSGLMTTIPLLLFAAGAQRLTLTVMGLVQYITPSITFFLAVFLYKEAFQLEQLTTFVLIWSGLAVFTIEGWRQRRRINQGSVA